MTFDAESLEALSPSRQRFYLRLQIASEILPHLLASKGEKTDKAWAAIGYADALLERLENTTNINNLEIKKNHTK